MWGYAGRVGDPPGARRPVRSGESLPGAWRRTGSPPPVRGWGVPVAESVLAPPGPIPNPVVTQCSAGEYCGGDPTGGEAAAGTPHPRTADGQTARTRRSPLAENPPRGGAAAARWAHNPKVGGSNPPPATSYQNATEHDCSVAFCCS